MVRHWMFVISIQRLFEHHWRIVENTTAKDLSNADFLIKRISYIYCRWFVVADRYCCQAGLLVTADLLIQLADVAFV